MFDSKVIGEYVLFAGAFILLVLLPIKNFVKKLKYSLVAEAEIIGVSTDTEQDEETGKTHEFLYHTSKYSRRFEPNVGKIVKLRINPNNPNEVYESSGIVISA